jgi:hypothetical protein
VTCLLGASSLEGATAGPSCREVITGPDGLTVSCSREGVQETAGIVPQPGTWSGESGEGVFRIEIDVCSDDRFFMEGRIICLGGSDPQVLSFLTSNSASHLGSGLPAGGRAHR